MGGGELEPTKKPESLVAKNVTVFFEHPLIETIAISWGSERYEPAPDGNKPFTKLQTRLREVFVGSVRSERTMDHIRAFIRGYTQSMVEEGVIGRAFSEDFVEFVFSIMIVG